MQPRLLPVRSFSDLVAWFRDQPDPTGSWQIEPKLDGWRVQLLKRHGQVAAYTRHGQSLAEFVSLQPLLAALQQLPFDLAWDGELIEPAGRARLIAARAQLRPVQVWLFDWLLPGLTLRARQAQLAQVLLRYPFLPGTQLVPRWDPTQLDQVQTWAQAMPQVEGWVLKRTASYYRLGRLGPICTPDWLKVKLWA